MLACDKTVTLVKCDGENYTSTVIVGVSWFDQARVKLETGGVTSASLVKVRIPSAVVPEVLPVPGDILVLGEVVGTLERPADLAPYRHAKIMEVSDNRRGGLPHLGVTCQ